jgi:hypothetical protein
MHFVAFGTYRQFTAVHHFVSKYGIKQTKNEYCSTVAIDLDLRVFFFVWSVDPLTYDLPRPRVEHQTRRLVGLIELGGDVAPAVGAVP